jgi:hypothetical protein
VEKPEMDEKSESIFDLIDASWGYRGEVIELNTSILTSEKLIVNNEPLQNFVH